MNIYHYGTYINVLINTSASGSNANDTDIKYTNNILPGVFRCEVGLFVMDLVAVDLEAPLFVLGGATG